MDSAKLVPMLVGLLLAVVMVGAVFVPVISSSTTRTITTEIENEGAEWLKLGYNQGTDYSFTVGFDGEDNFTVGTQTGEYKNLICYADNERTLFVSGDNWYLLTNGENPSVHKFTDTASVTNASGTLTITDGETTVYTGASPTWAYVPDANGVYGFFTEGGLNLEEGKPKVAVGSYAGVFAYNDTVVAPNGYGDLGLAMSGDYAEGEVIWEIPSELDTLEPAVLDLDPISIQPIDLGGSGSASLMTVDPSSGTNVGGIYYSVIDSTSVSAVGYSSSADWSSITSIPDTVTIDGVTYSVTKIGTDAFSGLTALSLTSLPESLTSIGTRAFNDCTNLSISVIPSNVTTIKTDAFNDCSGITSLIIVSSPSISSGAFTGTGIKEILNLGNTEITTTSYGLTADSVQDHVTALGYIAPTSIHESEVVPIDSPVAGLMQMLPLIAGIGALFFAVGTMIYTRF